MNTTPVAFFDFDGTLTNGDTLMPFLKYVVGKPTYYAKLALLSPVLAVYFARLLRNDTAKAIVLKHYFRGYSLDELRAMGERFSKEVMPTMLRPEGMERLEWHKSQGHICVLVSASLDVYLHCWAYQNGFSDVICTTLKCDENPVTGMLPGENCHGPQKVFEIKKYLADLRPEMTFAYGDSPADRLMLEYVDFGFMLSDRKLTLLVKR